MTSPSASVTSRDSLAIGQRSLGDPSVRFPLWPPLTAGCPVTSTENVSYPVEVDYAYDEVPAGLFAGAAGQPRGHDRWAPLLPPLRAPGLGEGGTPLVPLGDGLWIKDESRNPTWSHKDRINRVTVSAAVGAGAEGVVVASSGNHGASAAAYAARAGLRCVVIGSTETPPAVEAFLRAYGAVVLSVPVDARWPLLRRIVERFGYHPVSNVTPTHTGHAFGPEGYKTLAYEIFTELGVPGAVFLPTGYGELLFGVWKGFAELVALGLADRVPRLYSCEPAAGGPLAAALRDGAPATRVPVGETAAYAIGSPVGGYRGVVAVRESGGAALLVSDAEMAAARAELAGSGLWAELSAAAGLAGYRQLGPAVEGPVVCVSTSSGFKDRDLLAGGRSTEVDPEDWAEVERRVGATA
ncbi:MULTISPECIES: threonine synthase [unclassified Streptomyces]|uniref:threonine synthase n=1 Tax=unclassified Streptomyces TaxID=2593676 RepID=UPI00074AB797|nr:MULTISPECIES: pyridoxal-phosphate dependent enzyme [unclassified Streptomyces]KUL52777.1 threonine synthase [Streptomyces sp. NRRL S-1521]THC48050.1 pyridoxal-phosphate dependent enzyme [Streptomyces sp. A1499]